MSAYPDRNEYGERLAWDGSIGPSKREAEIERAIDEAQEKRVAWMDGDCGA
jgi:hypothetical protein